MNRYDDLQRFKDKTHTQSLTFKDLSGQSSAAERGDWAIVNQLSPSADGDEKKALGSGGSVGQAIPQPVSSDTFAYSGPPPAPVRPAIPESRVTAPQVPASQPTVAEQPAPAPVQPAAPAAPSAVPAQAPRPAAAAGPLNYSQLFAAQKDSAADIAEKQAKDLPLKSLLERIASCR